MRYVGVKLPERLYEEMVKRAREEGVTLSALIRRAVEAYLGQSPQSLQEIIRRVEELEARVRGLEAKVGELLRPPPKAQQKQPSLLYHARAVGEV